MTRKELMEDMPWHVRLAWWTMTVLTLAYAAPLLVVALLNPLWFRDAGFRWAEDHLRLMAERRDRLLENQFKKYRLLKIIKGS